MSYRCDAMDQGALTVAVEASSDTETHAVGRALGAVSEQGTVILLDGDLGAGKTRMTRGIADGLGIDPGAVTSPTFTLQQIYGPGTRGLTLTHDDAYRLEDGAAFVAAGLAESLDGPGVTVIEWASQVAEALERATFRVEIRRAAPPELPEAGDGPLVLPSDAASRMIRITACDTAHLQRLRERLPGDLAGHPTP